MTPARSKADRVASLMPGWRPLAFIPAPHRRKAHK